MTSTRWTTLLTFVFGTAGLAVLGWTDSIWIASGGGAAFFAAILVLFRHFWRLGQLNRHSDWARVSGFARQIEDVRKTAIETDVRLSTRMDASTRGILEEIAQIHIAIEQQQLEEARRMTAIKRYLDQATTHRDRILAQVEGVVAIYATLRAGRPYPQFGGWAISADLARRYVAMILSIQPNFVLEIGSGLSTVLAAKALEMIGGEGRVLALEHDAHWADVTNSALSEHGVHLRAEVLHAPLIDIQLSGGMWHWYDLSKASLPRQVDILLVDGPPKSTGELARYPALPLLLDRLTPDGVVLVDDGLRPDEAATVERWLNEFPDLIAKRHPDAKGTTEIRRGRH